MKQTIRTKGQGFSNPASLRTLVVMFAMLITAASAWADSSGTCGDPNMNGGADVTWTIEGTSMTISGNKHRRYEKELYSTCNTGNDHRRRTDGLWKPHWYDHQ